jgi:hypothetical protein
VSKEIKKIFLIEDFFHLPPTPARRHHLSTTPVVHLELRISPLIFEKKSRDTVPLNIFGSYSGRTCQGISTSSQYDSFLKILSAVQENSNTVFLLFFI